MKAAACDQVTIGMLLRRKGILVLASPGIEED